MVGLATANGEKVMSKPNDKDAPKPATGATGSYRTIGKTIVFSADDFSNASPPYPPPHPHLNNATDPGSIEVRCQS